MLQTTGMLQSEYILANLCSMHRFLLANWNGIFASLRKCY